MSGTVADQFAEILALAGVKRVYGIVGDSLNEITDALRRQGRLQAPMVHAMRGKEFVEPDNPSRCSSMPS